MKPSTIRASLVACGKTVIRVTIRYAGKHPHKKAFWVLTSYNGTGWETYSESLHYKTQEEATAAAIEFQKNNPNIILNGIQKS